METTGTIGILYGCEIGIYMGIMEKIGNYYLGFRD